ncbi:hypothetical protein LTR33_017893, partial [Friedmanniomyces endolithicus]
MSAPFRTRSSTNFVDMCVAALMRGVDLSSPPITLTLISGALSSSRRISGWARCVAAVIGFVSTPPPESVFGDDQTTVREQFKLTLDPEYQDDRGSTWEEARQWYFDYLTCLHREIEKFFDTSIPRWRSMRVEYSFSTPTTWKNPAMIAGIEKLIKSAGFTDTAQQTVRMALTEAEAAAIDASTT